MRFPTASCMLIIGCAAAVEVLEKADEEGVVVGMEGAVVQAEVENGGGVIPQSPDLDAAVEVIQTTGDQVMAAIHRVPVVFDEAEEEQEDGQQTQESRKLQTLNIVQTCDGYNANEGFDCKCRRSGRHDVFVDCTIDKRLCNQRNSTCWEQRFTLIVSGVEAQTRDFLPAKTITTCTQQFDKEPNLTLVADAPLLPSFETCVEVQPDVVGDFNGTVLCGAAVEGNLCNSCSQCRHITNETRITIDCCNVLKDGRQTCGFVHPESGITLPQYDPAGTHKGCNGRSSAVQTTLATAATLLVALVSASTLL